MWELISLTICSDGEIGRHDGLKIHCLCVRVRVPLGVLINNIMGKTILHFFDPILTARVGRPGVTVNENTGELEQTIDSPRIAPTGYYTVVEVGVDTHMYYRGIEYEPIGNGRNIQFKEAWELTAEEVFEY